MRSPRAMFKYLAALAALVAQASAFAGFNGTSFSTYYAYPDVEAHYPLATASAPSFTVIAGTGVETVFSVEGVTWISANFSDTSLHLSFDTRLHQPRWDWTEFNGLVFDVTGGGPLSFSGFTIDPTTNMHGFDASRVGLTGDRLTVDWHGLRYNKKTEVVINFASPVPEPETYAMFLAGLCAIGFVAWRRRPQN